MKIDYPPQVHQDMRHTLILYRLQELMRLRHNEEGAKYKNGEITEQEWNDFLAWWKPRSDAICEAILFYRDGLKTDTRYDNFIDLETIFVV